MWSHILLEMQLLSSVELKGNKNGRRLEHRFTSVLRRCRTWDLVKSDCSSSRSKKKKDKFKLNSSKSKWKSRQVFETRGNKWPLRIGVLFASWWWHFPGRWRVPKDTVGLLIRVLLELCEAGEVQVLFFMPKRVDASTELCPAAVPGPQWWCRKLQTMGSSSGNVAEEEFL